MNILYALQEMRHPIITELMVLITNLGSELLAIVVGATVFWCMDKIHGYYIFANIFFGAGVNHILKSCVRTPRPFDLEPDFEIVERAREGASGYSFPSGHTQNAFAVFGSLAVIFRRSIGSILCIAVIVLIAFSRLYLGVHYPSDVLGAALIGIILLPLLYLILEKSRNNPKLITILFGIGAVIFLAAGLIFEYGP